MYRSDTTARHIHRVLNVVLDPAFLDTVFQLSTASSTLAYRISANPKFYQFFKHVKGAIDGSNVRVFVGDKDYARYRGRQGNLTHDVLAACTFETLFCYILGGWEGSAADSFMFERAGNTTFTVPDGWYYLADAGFPCSEVLLVPYPGVHYHLREWGAANLLYA